MIDEHARALERADRAEMRRAWQRELILNDIRGEVPRAEYERQIDELRTALIGVEGSRSLSVRAQGRRGWAREWCSAPAARWITCPGPWRRGLVRRRHLQHVTVNMGHLTDPAYLGNPPAGRRRLDRPRTGSAAGPEGGARASGR